MREHETDVYTTDCLQQYEHLLPVQPQYVAHLVTAPVERVYPGLQS